MRRHTFLPLAVVCVLICPSAAAAQQSPPWTGIVADEARPALPPPAAADNQIVSRALSADGRFVVFSSQSPTLVAGDTNNTTDVFVRDRHTGVVSRVSVASDGSEANSYSNGGTISSNGRHIAFHSCASNLDPPNTDNYCDIYIHDRELGTTVRANLGPNGEQASPYIEHYNLSADGRYFVFNAGFDPSTYERQVWLRDRDPDANGIFDEPGTAITTQISQNTVGPWTGLFDFLDVAISPDGRYVSYNAWAFGPTGASGKWLFLHDRVAMTTVRVDVPAPGRSESNWSSYGADFSAAGHLVYVSNGNNITAGEPDFWYSDDVIVYDIATGVNTDVQLTHPGAPAVEYEWAPAISDDGRFVAFNGVTWDYDPIENVYVVDRQTGLSYDISVRPDGTRDNDAVGRPSISADGSAIAFVAGPAMLVNGFGDPGVFVVTHVEVSPPYVMVPGNGGTFTLDVTVPADVAWTLALEPAAGVAELSAYSGVGPGTVDVTVYPNYDFDAREVSVILGSERVRLEQGRPPYITFINPHSGSLLGGDSIEINGMGFAPGATVTIGGNPATNVVVVNSNLITAVTPAHPLGVARVTVTNPNGDSYDYYFFYRDLTPPVVTHEITGTPGANGWYISDVSVSWSYEDPESTIFVSSCVNPYVLTIDRLDSALCRVFSDGGETFEFVELKRDTVPPTLTIFPSEPETYFQGQLVPIALDCRDDTSGIASCTASQTGMHLDTSTAGTFTYTATAVDYAGHSVTKSTNYTVKIKPVIDVPEATGVYGGNATLRAVATAFGSGAPLAGKTISFFVAYVSVGTAITSATGEAVLTVPLGSLGAGNHPTHVEFAGDDSTLPLLSPGSLAIAKATPILTWANPASIAQGVPLGSTQLNATASVPGAFAYDPGFGTVLPPGTHTLTVNFAPADSANYQLASKTVTLKVKAIPVITWATPAAITYPRSLSGTELNATANVAGTFVYTPAFGTFLDAGSRTLSVTFTPSNLADYVVTSATVTLEVLKGTLTITWPWFDPIIYGTPLSATQLSATAPADGTMTFSPPAGTVLPAGTHTLTATFTPNPPNYHPATATRSLLVGKAYPPIWWPAGSGPGGDIAPIDYGTPLGDAQLNAYSTVPGTVTYNYPAGTVLNAGSHVITMTFTPDDTANYHTRTFNEYLLVRKLPTTVTWSNPASIVYGTALSGTQLNATASVPGSFSYSPPLGTILNGGHHSLYVYFTPTDSVNYETSSKYVGLEVEKRTPVITWNNPAPIVYGTALGWTQYNYTINVGGGEFILSHPHGTVLNAGAGQTLTVTWGPDWSQITNYNVVSKSVTIDVLKATPSVTWQPATGITYGTPLGAAQLNATANLPGSFAYTPAAGAVLPAGVNAVSTTFTPTDSANYEVVVTNRQVTVLKATAVLSWPTPAPIAYGTPVSSAQLNATANVPGTFMYTMTNGAILDAGSYSVNAYFTADDQANYRPGPEITAVIEVLPVAPAITWPNPAAIVYGTALSATQLNAAANVAGTFAYSHAAGSVLPAGTHTLTVTFTPASGNYTTATATAEIAVGKATPVVTWANPDAITYGSALSATQLNATANVDGTFAYSPAAGTALNAGTYQLSVTFTPADSANYVGSTASVTMTVARATPVITWPNPAGVTYGAALSATQLNATANVDGSFTYSPDAGTVLNAGTHELSVMFTPADWANYAPMTAAASIVVAKATPVITWANPAGITYGTALSGTQLNATANVNGSFVYSPATGTVLNAGSQTLSVTFTPDDAANYDGASANVSIAVGKAASVITWANPVGITYGTALSGTQLNATANVNGSFAYSPAAGTVLGAGTHSLAVTFTPDDSANYLGASADVSIVVGKAASVITWANPAGITYGTALSGTQLNATAKVNGSFVYSPVANTVLGAGTHSLAVTFTPDDADNYLGATADVSIVVGKAASVITWADPAGITYGTALSGTQLNATANVNGSFVYSPVAGTVPGAGSHSLTVTITPDDSANYTTATANVSIAVAQATPVITWANPAGITYGTALSGTQLNATANVNGSFAYSPAAGTVLGAGTQSLTVTFTPDDSANYASATANVSIAIAPAALTVRADNASKVYGQALPAFTVTGTGFVNGDSMASLGGTLAFTTSATATSAPGTYPVTPSGVSSANYSITFAAGTLTIAKAATSLTLTTTPNPSQNNQVVQLRAVITAVAPGAGTATGTIQFYENGTLLGTATLVNGVATMNKSFKKGTHPLTATFAGDANFTGSSGSVNHLTP